MEIASVSWTCSFGCQTSLCLRELVRADSSPYKARSLPAVLLVRTHLRHPRNQYGSMERHRVTWMLLAVTRFLEPARMGPRKWGTFLLSVCVRFPVHLLVPSEAH